MTQDSSTSALSAKQPTDGSRSRESKREKNFQTKVVIRRLPPTMTEPQFLEQVSPVPPNDYFHFVKADLSLGINAFSRVYLNFINQDDVFIFKDKFDGYVFIDTKGNEYPSIVEFAPFQKIPKRRSKKRDAKCGTLAQDPEYLKFLSNLENPDETEEGVTAPLPTAESYLEEIEARERELKDNGGAPKQTTPLIEYLKQRKLERQRVRDEKREERKRREIEKKKARDEERRKKKLATSSSHDKIDGSDSHSTRSGSGSGHYYSNLKDSKDVRKDTDNTNIKLTLLKNPERDEGRPSTNTSRNTNSYHDNYSNRERHSNRDRAEEDGQRYDRYRGDRGTRSGRDKERDTEDRGTRSGRDKERDTEKLEKNKDDLTDKLDKDRLDSDRYEHDSGKYRNDRDKDDRDRSDKGFMSRRERERQREKVAAARERERAKIQREKEEKKNAKTESHKVKGFASKRESSSLQSSSIQGAGGIIPDDPAIVAAAIEKPKSSNSNYGSNNNEGGSSSSGENKDPRMERRIRNKDRPSLEIYRPGMRRLSGTPQGGSSSSGKVELGQSNSQNNSADNSPRSYSPLNEEPFLTIACESSIKDNTELENQRLSDDIEC